MTIHLKAALLCFGVAMSLPAGVSGAAPQKKSPQPVPAAAPIPAQILAAKKVFIANGGGDESRYE